ncbi:MAG: sugar ABC transporter ATP-binding protein [Gaiellales bacterium]
MSETLLRTREIGKRFGAIHALAEVDFEIGAGEIVALAGENGSGKSTLAKILAGVTTPDEGVIEIDGRPVRFQRPRDALDRGIALVAQEPTDVPQLTVAENLLLTQLPRPLAPFRRRSFNQRAKLLLERVGVDASPTARLGSLGTGDRELVEIAKALATDPRVLILDEATSRFGEHDVRRLFAILRSLRESGVATILITHRLNEITEIADRAVVLRDGRRVGEIGRAEITGERVASMMVGRELKDYFHKRTITPGEPVLEVDGLIVDGTTEPVSFTVRSGEIVALAGLVGCGRTELVETIFGARRPRGGTVSIAGKSLRRSSPRRTLEHGIALVPEDRHRQGLNLRASVRENIVLGSWGIARADGRRERRTAERMIDRLKIRTSRQTAPIRSLSGGNQQKVVVGRCLAREPRVLLLDEPTRGIDVGAKEEMFQLLGEMLEDGIAIVLVSSELMEVLGLADRVLVMHEHRVAAELSRAEATEERIAFLSAGGEEALVA